MLYSNLIRKLADRTITIPELNRLCLEMDYLQRVKDTMVSWTQGTSSLSPKFETITVNNVITNTITTVLEIPLFPRSSGHAPASGLQAAALLTPQSSGAGTIKPEWPVLAFDKDTDEGRIWNDQIPYSYVSSISLSGQIYMATVTSGTVVFSAQMACWSDADATCTAKVFDSANSVSAITVPGVATTIKAFSFSLSNVDNAVALDSFSLAFFRDISEDNAAEDVLLKTLTASFNLIL